MSEASQNESEDSHSSRKRTSESRTSLNESEVSISELEPFDTPSDLAKRSLRHTSPELVRVS